jgi:hypothetical protein
LPWTDVAFTDVPLLPVIPPHWYFALKSASGMTSLPSAFLKFALVQPLLPVVPPPPEGSLGSSWQPASTGPRAAA